MIKASVVLFAAMVWGVGAAASRAKAAQNPMAGYSGYTNSYFLPYVNDPGFGALNATDPQVSVGIGNLDLSINLDTGSRGLYVSMDTLGTNITTNAESFAGQIYLNSSARIFEGEWTPTVVSFSVEDQNGGMTNVSATVPVLDVQTLACSTNPAPGSSVATTTFNILHTAPSSGTVILTSGQTNFYSNWTVALLGGEAISYLNNPQLAPVANFGVGFDRTGQGTFPNTNNINQSYNAFLNLFPMTNGTMEAGYILQTNGIQLGLTQNTTNFAYTQLHPTGFTNASSLHTVPDWQAPTGEIFSGGQINPTGQVVVDIGIGDSILTLPGQTNGNLSNPPLSVDLINSGGAVGYNITTDSNNLLNPSFDESATSNVELFPPLAGNFSENQPPTSDYFFNTGRNVLNAFDFLYDGENGYVGLITNGFADGNTNISFQSGFYPASVPEPSSTPLLMISALALVVLLRGRFFRNSRR